MTITINWATQVISIPKIDTQLIQSNPTEIRSLDLDAFRLTLKDLEDDEEGIPFIDTHSHNPPVTVGGVTLARVIEIINGYTVTFEDGAYAVNLVGANSNVGDVTTVNQVSIRSANSAGLTFSLQVENTAFQDARVWVDTNIGLPGTQYPRGTVSDPVSNLADAQTIISIRNLPTRLHLTGVLTILGSEDISNYNIEGESSKLAVLTVNTGALTTNLVIQGLAITGDLNGNITAKEAVSFSQITDFDGKLISCGLMGVIDLGSGIGESHDFIDCYSEQAADSRPIIDANDLDDIDLQIRRYSGGIEIRNYSGANNVASIDLTVGKVVLTNTCTAGTILVRGVGELVDNSGPGCTIMKSGLLDTEQETLTHKIIRNKFTTDPTTGKAIVFDDDGVTTLVEGNLFEDVAGTQAYRGQGAERRERLE